MARIAELVCSSESAKELKTLGVPQKSLFYWVRGQESPLFGETVIDGEQVCNQKQNCRSAYTVGELGIFLRHKKFKELRPSLAHLKEEDKFAGVCMEMPEEDFIIEDSEAEARAKLLIYMLNKIK